MLLRFLLFAVDGLALPPATPPATAVVKRAPLWLTIPTAGSEAQLKAALQWTFPPRSLQHTAVSTDGRSAAGRCLPYALLQQLAVIKHPAAQRLGRPTLAALDSLRDEVLNFASVNADVAWDSTDSRFSTFAKVVGAVCRLRGWEDGSCTGRAAVQRWACRLRRASEAGDAAFLFAAAACFGLRIHVHYTTNGRLVDTTFASPPTAAVAFLPPNENIHVGFIANGDDTHHYVSVPTVWAGVSQC